MTTDNFSEWLERQGLQVYFTQSSNWVTAGPRILQSFPYCVEIQPDQREINELFKKSKAIALRYSTPLNSKEGQISYHVIFEGNEFKYENFSKKVRHDIQHGLEYYEYKPISFELLEDQGWKIREDTLIRQGRRGAEKKEWWSKLCRSAEGLPGFEAWGAVKQEKLVASIFTYINDGTASILYQQSLTDHLKFGINNTLAYSFVNDILNNRRASKIFYGLHSLDAPSSVDEFKFRMGFAAKPVRQRVVFNPVVARLFNQVTHAGLKSIHKIIPGNPTIAKAEGMVRFYLEGKLPLARQQWPEILLDQKESILASEN
jgi:hypothetical protein